MPLGSWPLTISVKALVKYGGGGRGKAKRNCTTLMLQAVLLISKEDIEYACSRVKFTGMLLCYGCSTLSPSVLPSDVIPEAPYGGKLRRGNDLMPSRDYLSLFDKMISAS